MENMINYIRDRKGRTWYICRDCGNKELSQFTFCPVCKNVGQNPNPRFREALANLIVSALRGKV